MEGESFEAKVFYFGMRKFLAIVWGSCWALIDGCECDRGIGVFTCFVSELGGLPFPKFGLFVGGLLTDYRESATGNILVGCIYAHGVVGMLLDILPTIFVVISDNARAMM